MFSLIVFIVTGILWYIFAIFNAIEFIDVIILSLLTSICISVPYYAKKILNALPKDKDNKEDEHKFYWTFWISAKKAQTTDYL